MSAPLVPSPLDCIGRRRFAFFPAIKNGGPNEWLLGTSSWSEVQVVNAHTGAKLWIARSNIGGIAEHTGVLTVGLRKKLEYSEGAIKASIKTVIEIPHAATEPIARSSRGPAPVIAIRLEERKKSSVIRAALGIVVGGLVIALLAAWLGSTLLNS